ncbi:MAG TPA: NBR1-Ig-like domain-containing protein [Kofleriaceae bacterium]|nr:NBR1-Ig-like domain-containing protein [Kofleriaceae bacterium]
MRRGLTFLSIVAAAMAAGAAACDRAPELATWELASEVGDYETTSCATAVVIELSRQIAAEVDCMAPGQLVPFAEGNGIVFAGSAVLPYVSETAREDLYAAVTAGAGTSLQVTSAYRTVVQQYLLYRWFQLGRCGITAAATPGSSNHESGRALDVSNYSAWIATLGDHAWDHSVPGDPVHFDHTQSPDIRGTDVLAIQRLWNRNHTDDPIAEDGDYGPDTEARLVVAPAEGFPQGAICAPGGLDMAIVSIDAPRVLAPDERAPVTIVVRNSGTVAWPAGTSLVTAEPVGRASGFSNASWAAPDAPSRIGAAVAPGETATLTFELVGPVVTTAEERTEAFAMDADGARFGMVVLVVQVDPGEGGGCCSASGNRGRSSRTLAPLATLALLATFRRRRRRGTIDA